MKIDFLMDENFHKDKNQRQIKCSEMRRDDKKID